MAKATKKAAATAPKTAKKASPKAATKTAKKAAPKTAKKAAAKGKGGGKANAAFMAPLTLSPELAEVTGKTSLPRTEIIKKIWDYIKANDLQDSKNRRMINGDEKLKKLFGKDQVSMFELAKIVNNHVK